MTFCRCKNCILTIGAFLYILFFSSCFAKFRAVAISAKGENIYIEGQLELTKRQFEQNPYQRSLEALKIACQENDIDNDYKFINDSTILFYVKMSEFNQANAFMLNIDYYMKHEMGENSFHMEFQDLNEGKKITIKFIPDLFVHNGVIGFDCDENNLQINPSQEQRYLIVGLVSDKSVGYVVKRPSSIVLLPMQTITLKYGHNLAANSSWFLSLLHEHFWLSLSTILCGLVAFIQLMNFLNKRK